MSAQPLNNHGYTCAPPFWYPCTYAHGAPCRYLSREPRAISVGVCADTMCAIHVAINMVTHITVHMYIHADSMAIRREVPSAANLEIHIYIETISIPERVRMDIFIGVLLLLSPHASRGISVGIFKRTPILKYLSMFAFGANSSFE